MNPRREAPVNNLTIVYIVVIFVAFYFLLIRPQQKRSKEQAVLLASLKVGDRIVTVGGLYGTIERLSEDIVDVRIADGVVVEMSRAAIGRKVDTSGHVIDEEPAEAPEIVPAKPASGDVEEPPVHVGADDHDAPAADDAPAPDVAAKDE